MHVILDSVPLNNTHRIFHNLLFNCKNSCEISDGIVAKKHFNLWYYCVIKFKNNKNIDNGYAFSPGEVFLKRSPAKRKGNHNNREFCCITCCTVLRYVLWAVMVLCADGRCSLDAISWSVPICVLLCTIYIICTSSVVVVMLVGASKRTAM